LDRTKQTYLERISIQSPSKIKKVKVVFNNFERFCGYDLNEYKLRPEDAFDVLQKWINKNHEKLDPVSNRQYFEIFNDFLYYKGIKLDRRDIDAELTFPTMFDEEKHPITHEEIRKIFDVAKYDKKAIYSAMITSGMSIGEVIAIRKKHLTIDKRIMVKVPSIHRKVRRFKTTFIANWAAKYIINKLPKLGDEDYVWGFDGDTTSNEDTIFSNYCSKVGLDQKYETKNRRKITLHSFRSFFITQGEFYNEKFVRALAGHRKYLPTYTRIPDQKKMEIYMELEPCWDIYEIDKLKLENSKLRSENITVEYLNERLNDLTKIMNGFTKEHTHLTQLSDNQ
jgi:integrase